MSPLLVVLAVTIGVAALAWHLSERAWWSHVTLEAALAQRGRLYAAAFMADLVADQGPLYVTMHEEVPLTAHLAAVRRGEDPLGLYAPELRALVEEEHDHA